MQIQFVLASKRPMFLSATDSWVRWGARALYLDPRPNLLQVIHPGLFLRTVWDRRGAQSRNSIASTDEINRTSDFRWRHFGGGPPGRADEISRPRGAAVPNPCSHRGAGGGVKKDRSPRPIRRALRAGLPWKPMGLGDFLRVSSCQMAVFRVESCSLSQSGRSGRRIPDTVSPVPSDLHTVTRLRGPRPIRRARRAPEPHHTPESTQHA